MRVLFTAVLLLIAAILFAQTDSTEIKLLHYKSLFDKGLINESEYESLKKNVLGISQPQQPQQIIVVEKAQPAVVVDTFGLTTEQLKEKGRNDARRYFNTGGVFGGTFAATLFGTPVIGLIPAIACSATRPKEANFNAPNEKYLRNPDYYKAYANEAHRQKKVNAWTAWGVSTGINILVTSITVAVLKEKEKKR